MIRSALTYIFSLITVLTVLSACTKEYDSIETVDNQNIQNYIQQNNLSVQQYKQTGIYYKVIKNGTGPDLDYTQKIPLLYTLKTIDGTYTSLDTFNNHYADYFGYFKPDSLREVLKYGLVKQGGILRIIIPSHFAFGKSGSGSIPGNSSLDYTITAITASKLAEYDDNVIKQYMTTNNLTGFTKSATGIYYKIATMGTGVDAITNTSILNLEYTGKLFNGVVFDKTETGSTAVLLLGQLIEGWKQTLPLIKEGGSIRILIPSALGYGLTGNQAIPPFSCLDFDIKVTDVN